MMKRRDMLALGLAGLVMPSVTSVWAFAQHKYPERPIRLVVPFPPGGIFDSVGRPWAEKMKGLLGTVVVENHPGGAGSVAAAAVARAQPDGYTILLGGSGALVVNPIASSRPAYDPVGDFEPIALLVVGATGLVVNPNVPVQSLAELVAYAKRSPAKLSYGSAGVGSGTHLGAELFKSLTGLDDLVHVPYRGAGPALADLIGGQIPIAAASVTGHIINAHNTGQLRLLAVTSRHRLAAAPDIPTAIEAGVPDLIAENFVGLFAPKGTPAAIVQRIVDATREALAQPDLQNLYVKSGFLPQREPTPEETRQLLQGEIARWKPVIKALNLNLD
jgi:tripartite-type tricarboxylate transporter receptor subunit TctC